MAGASVLLGQAGAEAQVPKRTGSRDPGAPADGFGSRVRLLGESPRRSSLTSP